MNVRRFVAGELTGQDKDLTAVHLEGCARCAKALREIAEEGETLHREVPFEVFAAGVAERLAEKPARRRSWVAPLAAAAGLLLVTGTALVLRPSDGPGVRSKGAAGAQLFVQDARGVRELGDEPLAPQAKLQIKLHPGARQHATATLIEPGEKSVLYDGPAISGSLPQSFEWTGSGKATLRIVFSGGKGDPETIEFTLHR
jgi:hypothetical protein